MELELEDQFAWPLGYSGITLGSVLWKSYFGLLTDHSGECAVKELYFGLLRDHFGQCAVEELLWATQGHSAECAVEELLWATQGSGECAVEELSWATGGTEVQSSQNLTTPQSYGWGTNKVNKRQGTYKQQTNF